MWTALPLTPTPVPCKLNVDMNIHTFYMHPFWPAAGRTERFTLIYLYLKKHLNRWISKHCFLCWEQSVLTQGIGLPGRLYFLLKQVVGKGNTSLSCPPACAWAWRWGLLLPAQACEERSLMWDPMADSVLLSTSRTAHDVPAEYLPLPPGELLLEGRHHIYHLCLPSTRIALCTE